MNSPIILDMDTASPKLWAAIRAAMPMPGVWGLKIGDKILQNGMGILCPLAHQFNVFIDLKHYDTRNRLGRIVELYAKLGEYAPKLLTISGDACKSKTSLEEALAARKNINIILTGVLSSWTDNDCWDTYSMAPCARQTRVHRIALENGAQGMTCPAWLFEDEDTKLDIAYTVRQGEFFVVATGIRSKGMPAGNHKKPRTPEFALERGATHVVVGSEIIGADNPLAALRSLAERCLAVKKYEAPAEQAGHRINKTA